jgi:hypothetical protein
MIQIRISVIIPTNFQIPQQQVIYYHDVRQLLKEDPVSYINNYS